MTHMVGIDEVGRGPIAGPVTVCALTAARGLDPAHLKGIRDSKKLSPARREKWFAVLSVLKKAGLIDFTCTSVSAREIDAIGISKAIQKALDASLAALRVAPRTTEIFLDGSLHAPAKFKCQQTIIKGDEKVPLIGAASIIAKVTRDRYMGKQSRAYPGYGFEKHKGYGTSAHYKAIDKLGMTPLHRRTFLKKISVV